MIEFNFIPIKKRHIQENKITIYSNSQIVFTKDAMRTMNNPDYVLIEIDSLRKVIKFIPTNDSSLGRKIRAYGNSQKYITTIDIKKYLPSGIYKPYPSKEYIYVLDSSQEGRKK